MDDKAGRSEPEADRERPPRRAATQGPRGVARRIYDHWRRAAHALGVVHTRAIMLVVYVAMVVPTGLLMRRFRDPLHLRAPQESNWIPLAATEHDLNAARRQY